MRIQKNYSCAPYVNPISSPCILPREILDDLMRTRMQVCACSIRELWGRSDVSRACGGYVNKIIEAILQDPEQNWDIEFKPEPLNLGAQMEDAVFLILKGFEEPVYLYNDGGEEINTDGSLKTSERKVKKKSWIERDLDLDISKDIQGMRLDDLNPVQDEAWVDEWTESSPDDETSKEWAMADTLPSHGEHSGSTDDDWDPEVQHNSVPSGWD